jgi:hypothetical protein
MLHHTHSKSDSNDDDSFCFSHQRLGHSAWRSSAFQHMGYPTVGHLHKRRFSFIPPFIDTFTGHITTHDIHIHCTQRSSGPRISLRGGSGLMRGATAGARQVQTELPLSIDGQSKKMKKIFNLQTCARLLAL